MNKEKHFTLIKILGVLVVLFLIMYGIKHFRAASSPQIPAPPVAIQKPVLAKVTGYITQTGSVVAYNSVNLVARVEGYLDEIKFTDGTFVKKGDVLFIIQPNTYLEKVNEAKASVAVQKADFQYSKSEYARQNRMYKENATSLNNVEKWSAKTDASEAEVSKAIANEAIANINYSYTHVLAPFDGRIGRHLIDVGNLVGNGKATNLATIEQINPIYVYFNLNELDLIKVRTAAKEQGIEPSDIKEIPVYVGMQNEEGFPHKGKLNFVSTGLNASTGTMGFRALLPNPNYSLLPGYFVQVRLAISKPNPQLTVPDTSVQYDQIGAYLLTVDADNKVVLKRVEIGGVENGMRTIYKGITVNDQVIISGLQNATPGNPVAPQANQGSLK